MFGSPEEVELILAGIIMEGFLEEVTPEDLLKKSGEASTGMAPQAGRYSRGKKDHLWEDRGHPGAFRSLKGG